MALYTYRKGIQQFREGLNIRELSKTAIRRIAKEYAQDAIYLEDLVRDMEDEGIKVEEQDLIDMIINGDC